jgi:two-component system cell cycle response regulator DivK
MSTRTRVVLVVEDVELNRDLLMQLLEDDFDVLVAVDGAQAVEMARSEQPDIVLMDLSLPVMSGWEATSTLKADPELRHIPVIAVTAHAMPGDERRAREAGADDYLTKPIDEDLLFAKLIEHLGPEPE